jgi:hypothetical protein
LPRPVEKAIEEAKTLPPRTKVEIMRGFHVRLKNGGIPVFSLHYTAHPDRDPKRNPQWYATERPKYSSQGAWDREQEVKDYAGGGELVFADTLITHWKKIVISDPKWRPDPEWDCYGGFDHGKTNPTCLGRCYVDFIGNKYLCGEYYMPGLEVWEHAPNLKRMEDVRKIQACWADPTIFDELHQQSQKSDEEDRKKAKSTNDLYIDEGIELFSPFKGDRGDWSCVQRVQAHWKNLDQEGVMPKLFIVCRFPDVDAPRPGLHSWDCPNLLWEMMRMRKEKFTAVQLMSRNPSERIVQKNNHAFDAILKYILMSLPEPTEKSKEQILSERLAHIPKEDVTSRVIRGEEILAELDEDDVDVEEGIPMGRRRPRRG